MKKILFLCTGNSCRSQMAEGFANFYGKGKIEAFSAGTNPTTVNTYAIQVMKEAGIDISGQKSKNVSIFAGREFDYIITLCGSAKENCPFFPGKAVHLHWDIQDPATAKVGEADILTMFRTARDEIKSNILSLYKTEHIFA